MGTGGCGLVLSLDPSSANSSIKDFLHSGPFARKTAKDPLSFLRYFIFTPLRSPLWSSPVNRRNFMLPRMWNRRFGTFTSRSIVNAWTSGTDLELLQMPRFLPLAYNVSQIVYEDLRDALSLTREKDSAWNLVNSECYRNIRKIIFGIIFRIYGKAMEKRKKWKAK